MKSASPSVLARSAFEKHLEVHGNLDHYTGIVSLHGLARLAVLSDSPGLLKEARHQLMPYVRGERSWNCNFPNYLCGGNASAFLLYSGHLPEVADPVRKYAEQLMREAPRDPSGILSHPKWPSEHRIWIDTAFAVTPFLLFAGLALQNEEYVEEAYQQTAKMVDIFRNAENGLLHQSRNFNGPGRFSEDHWSRGNGWGAYALTELAVYLPESHPRKSEAVRRYVDHVESCASVQNRDGLWCQEMTEHRSYVETSGSALLLYALAAGIRAGLIAEENRSRLENGLRGLLAYISTDLDIYHTCRGCLSPGQGTKLDYMAQSPLPNDCHAFGPVVLAMAEAAALGIKEI